MEAARRPRFLIDQNLSPRLVRKLADLYPDSDHVFHAGLDQALDHQLRAYARLGRFIILTKDRDHARLARDEGRPPRVAWVRVGNCTSTAVEELLRARRPDIVELAAGRRGLVLEVP
ncbi:MAG TPA: DUF5615 family PIN-like protein [Planctomycetota bacterium]|nr:DUF5615 family PIN-like protein [Planctomycetota bacterium]